MLQVNLVAKQKQSHRRREQTCGYQGGMNGEIGVDVCAVPHAKKTAGENLLHRAGSSAGRSVMASMDGMRWWREIQQGGIYVYI